VTAGIGHNPPPPDEPARFDLNALRSLPQRDVDSIVAMIVAIERALAPMRDIALALHEAYKIATGAFGAGRRYGVRSNPGLTTSAFGAWKAFSATAADIWARRSTQDIRKHGRARMSGASPIGGGSAHDT
jgi:hypothetical protein